MFFFERRYLRLKEHPVVPGTLCASVYIVLDSPGRVFGGHVTNFRRVSRGGQSSGCASWMVHRPIRLGSCNSATLFRGLSRRVEAPPCLCARRSRQTIWCRVLRSPDRAAAVGPPFLKVFRTHLWTCIVHASRPAPRAYRWFHTNSWLRGISWEPLGLRSLPIARGCRVSGTNLHAPSLERCLLSVARWTAFFCTGH